MNFSKNSLFRIFSIVLPFLVFPMQFASENDIKIPFYSQGKLKEIKWQKKSPTPKDMIQFTPEAALRSECGVQMGYESGLSQNEILFRAPLLSDFWMRFYLRADSLWDRKNLDETSRFIFLGLNFFDLPHGRNVVEYSIGCETKSSEVSFYAILSPFLGNVSKQIIRIPIVPKQIYCLESHFIFFNKDSFAISVYLNGKRQGRVASNYTYALDSLRILGTTDITSQLQARISLDNITLTDQRPFALPEKPTHLTAEVTDSHIRLSCTSDTANYAEEQITAVEWRVWGQSDSLFPLFNVVESEPIYRTQRPIPFALDSGTCFFQVRRRNNFNNWSAWSTSSTFVSRGNGQSSSRIKKVYFTKPGKKDSITTLIPERWYDLNICLDSTLSWDSVAYVLVYLHDTSYTLGNPTNKGGSFSSSSNYTFNFNLYRKEFRFYEKARENSFRSTPLDNQRGHYADASNHLFTIDTTGKKIRLRMKLLEQACIGPWQLVCYLRDPHDSLCGIYKARIQVLPIPTRPSKLFWGVSTLIFLMIGVLAFQKRQKNIKKSIQAGADLGTSAQSPEFLAIRSYILSRLHDKFTSEDVWTALKISKPQYQRIMKEHKTDFPTLLNSLRIQEAKKLMETTDKNISEICFSVGYSNMVSFFRAFQKIEGVSPKSYRESTRFRASN